MNAQRVKAKRIAWQRLNADITDIRQGTLRAMNETGLRRYIALQEYGEPYRKARGEAFD
ncbi:hypothetical protein [Bradyrhizobium sp. SEMIA]|uniref:hypothetical protein n=1 Tax=Bradyrhizobium sp. SEMIA TaxID=2597515 RepID=UPI0018A654E1|nr:hypothetical protein [Bradyrhizobium sp. SEMIA]QOG23474.1 hypothetical protein FOM02_45770 [Bradyrhizobium sp. SEMIA]